jgi:hypothetical protein
MNNRNEKYLIFTIIICVSFLLTGCKRDKVPVISTSDIDEITETTATSGGNITNDGGATVTARGVCWSTGSTPTTADSKTTDGSGSGGFSSKITGLDREKNYYVRAYATNSTGTGYGEVISFDTPLQSPGPPIAITKAATDITNKSVTLWGAVYPNYSRTSMSFELGMSASYGNIFTNGTGNWFNQESPTGGKNTIVFFHVNTPVTFITLTPGTTYHYRIFASNQYGTSYGDDMTFTTLPN